MRGTLFILLLCCFRVFGAYSPGVGIPDPASWWSGLDPVDDVRPVDPPAWPAAEAAGFYYIDNTHGSATDSANTYGYPDKPRATMPTTLAAGSVVVLRGGPYSPANYVVSWNGTDSSPIWISGDPVNRTEFRNEWRIVTGTWLFIENIFLDTKDEDQFKVGPTADDQENHHIAVRNCDIRGLGVNTGNGALCTLGSDYNQPVHDIVLYQCIAREGGDWQAEVSNDKLAFAIGHQLTNVWWIQCTAYHMGGDGFGAGHDAEHLTHSLFLDGCTSYENLENAVDLKEVHNVVISGCHFYNFSAGPDADGEAIVIHYGPDSGEGTRDIWIINNRIHDCMLGIVSTETTDSWWIGNGVWNCNIGLYPDRGGGNIRVWNNTIINCPWGIVCAGEIDSLHLRNNLLVGSVTNLIVGSSAVRSASVVSNECYFNNGEAYTISWGTAYNSVAAWIAGTTVGDGSISADPLFTSGIAFGTNSPCWNTGVDVSTQMEADYIALFQVPLNYKDMNGVTRPQLGAWDIGAFEYAPASGNGRVVRAKFGNVRIGR